MTEPVVAWVRSPDADTAVFGLVVSGDHPAFAGHFPGTPILPGVVQIDWAVRLADAHFGLNLAAARHFQVKYRRVITPDSPDVTLTLSLDRAKGTVGFTFATGGVAVSTGRITLPAEP